MGDKGGSARRARKTGEFTAKRGFRNDQTAMGVSVQILPTANTDDAHVQLNHYASGTGIERWKGITTLERKMISDIDVSGVTEFVAWEKLNERDGVQGYARTIVGRVGRMIFHVHGAGEACTWSLVIEIANSQVRKLKDYDAE